MKNKLKIEETAFFKYTPITSVNVEQIFHGTKFYIVITDAVTNLIELKKKP
jgi:hypothetical protein